MATRIEHREALSALRERVCSDRSLYRRSIRVCNGTGCRVCGAASVTAALQSALASRGLVGEVEVIATGCHGYCERSPIVVIEPEGILYQRVEVEDAPRIVSATIERNELLPDLCYEDPITGERIPHERDIRFYAGQYRIVSAMNGKIDPTSITDYIGQGGYEGLAKALIDMTPEEIIEEVKAARLRGRGGAGFPTGVKWELTRQAAGEPKYLICNADEGDPGAFMDCSLLEGNPHSVLEGMIIAARAIGASEGYVYVRAEYPLAIERVRKALADAREYGLLGHEILGTDFHFDIHIKAGAGAFVCGEETALIASIEGRRGTPRPRPPFPAQAGLWGKPTNINNVETFANIPLIIVKGADWYAQLGTERSKGTKIFSLTGKVANTGLVEVPIGTTLRHIVFDIGGGMRKGRQFKAAQLGGPSGGCVPAQYLDLPIDYETLQEVGAIMGSGGMVVMDDKTCIVDTARFFLEFVQSESCGKCVPCRVGTKRMLEMVSAVCRGEGTVADLDTLEQLALHIKASSLCGLGQTAPNPVLSTLRHFRDEYIAHIEQKHCEACVCLELVESPCHHTCPLHMSVPQYIGLIAAERFEEAAALIKEENPLPQVLGRVCNHRCETKCRRADIDEPIAICALKRFAVEQAGDRVPKVQPPPIRREERIAIVGAGPCGLSAARRLALLGYRPTIFEALSVTGGMLRVGIPAYRLPRDVLDAEIDEILSLGIALELGVRLGQDITVDGLLAEGFAAVLVATGAHGSVPLRIDGMGVSGVHDGLAFLREFNLGHAPWMGQKAVVVGGGDVAMDCARVLLRTGAHVEVLYRRTQEEMPAADYEVAAAEEEGVKFNYLVGPQEVLAKDDGEVIGLRCVRMELGPMGMDGRRRPIPIAGSEFVVEADTIIAAVGQQVEWPFDDKAGVEQAADGTVQVNPRTLSTTREGVFAGGDCVLGPATVVWAAAHGERAARAIDAYLRGVEMEPMWTYPPAAVAPDICWAEISGATRVGRARQQEAALSERCRSFVEVEQGLEVTAAVAEARRCLRCDLERRRALTAK
ncbi:MAG: NADH-quinone oxidoreductase subunit NuoF [Candidatus Zipacnadales bacterium]